MIAPVSVARSTIVAGANSCCVQVIASHSTRRPSASVLMTSIVWPDIEVTTSPGRCAAPSGIFSTSPQMPTTSALALRSASVSIAPATAPAPPISHFMSSMPAGGLRLIPPVSKVTPFPTSAVGLATFAPLQRIARIRESRREPCPTPSSAPIPSAVIAALSSTVISMPNPSSRARQRSTKLSG